MDTYASKAFAYVQMSLSLELYVTEIVHGSCLMKMTMSRESVHESFKFQDAIGRMTKQPIIPPVSRAARIHDGTGKQDNKAVITKSDPKDSNALPAHYYSVSTV